MKTGNLPLMRSRISSRSGGWSKAEAKLKCGPRCSSRRRNVRMLLRSPARSLQWQEKSADVMPTAVRAVAGMPGRRKLARSQKSRARQMLAHCSHCGSWRHKTPRCPDLLASGSPDEGNLVEFAKVRNKRKRKLVAHLKYTNIDQRCGVYEGRPPKRARARACRTFLEYSRFAAVLTVDGLLVDMTGAPCPHPKCLETKVVFNKERVLGKLTSLTKCESPEINACSVYRRCKACRNRCPVNYGNPLLSGTTNVTQGVLAIWNAVHGVSLTTTCLQLGVTDEAAILRRCPLSDV